jgi:hypothetical protein
VTQQRWTATGKFMRPREWTNKTTEEVARWLVENLVGETVVGIFWDMTWNDTDTPTRDLGERLRDIFVSTLPVQVSDAWMYAVDWTQLAQFLISFQ